MKSYDKKDNSLKEKYPSSNCDKVNSFIKEKNLTKDFYPCFQISIQLYDVLEHKKYFLSIEKKYDSYLKKLKKFL